MRQRLHRYTLHAPAQPDAEPVLLREGFSLWAFLFSGFWLLYHRVWVAGLALVAIGGLIEWAMRAGWLDATPAAAAQLLLSLYAGTAGRDLLRDALAARAMPASALLYAENEDAALLRYYGEMAR